MQVEQFRHLGGLAADEEYCDD